MALSAKLIRGSTVNLAEHGLKLGLMFVITPLMIKHLGEKDYGIWLLALAIIAWLRLLDLGISFSGTRFLAQALGSEDEGEIRSLTQALTWLFNWIGLISLFLTAAICVALPIWISDPSLLGKVRWLILGFGISTGLRFWTRIFEVVLKSHVRYDLIGIASIIKSALQGGFIIYFLLTGHGLVTLLILFIVTDVLDQGILIFFARRVQPDSGYSVWPGKPKRIKPLLQYSATAMVTSSGHNLRGGIDPLIIANVATVAAVPLYSVGARFLSVFSDIINAIFGGNFLAAFSQLHGRDDQNLLIDRFLSSIRLSAAIAVLGGSVLLIYGPVFIERWIGPAFGDSAIVLLILTPPTVLSLMQYPIWGFFYSQNKQHWLATLTFGGGLFNVGLSLYLAHQIGFFGVVWATLIEMSIGFGVLVPIMVSRVCRISLRRYFQPMALSFFKIAALSAAYYFLIRRWIAPDYLRLILLGIGHLVVAFPVFLFFIFSGEERKHLREAVPFLKISKSR